jgi:hypothetical protein
MERETRSLTAGNVFPDTRRMSLLETTQRLLSKATRTYSLRAIADRSGGAINYEWLKKFAAGKIDNPGVTTIEDLHKTLHALNS